MGIFSLSSPTFKEQGTIPKEYSCMGNDSSPELLWKNPPQTTKSFALTVVDPDVPQGDFIHWVIYNIPAEAQFLAPQIAKNPVLADATMQGMNDFGTIGYGGPCPPESQTHAYIFTLYALDSMLPLPPQTSYTQLRDAMKGHILAEAKLTGSFKK